MVPTATTSRATQRRMGKSDVTAAPAPTDLTLILALTVGVMIVLSACTGGDANNDSSATGDGPRLDWPPAAAAEGAEPLTVTVQDESSPATTNATGSSTSSQQRATATTISPSSTQSTTTAVSISEVVYVDASTSLSGDGSSSAPFRTLADGLEAVRAGQTLVVRGGEYRERIHLGNLADGEQGKPIQVVAAPGERVVVRGRLKLNDLRHWSFRGINVTWDSDRNKPDEHMVVFQGGSHWEFRAAEIWGARSFAGILVAGDPSNWALRYLYVHDTHPSNDTNQDHLIYCNCGSGGGTIERNLLIGSPNGRGIKVGTVRSANTPISNLVIRYNTIVDNLGPSNIQLSYNTSNVTVERNLMVSPRDGHENVTGYKLNGSNNIVRSNIGWNSAGVVDDDSGLQDAGDNQMINPDLDADYRPRNSAASGYGHLAP